MGWKTLLGLVNKLLKTKSLLRTTSNVLPLYLEQTCSPIIWIFTKGEGDGIESRLPFKIFSTLLYANLWYCIPSGLAPKFCIVCKTWFVSNSFRTHTYFCRLSMTTEKNNGLPQNDGSKPCIPPQFKVILKIGNLIMIIGCHMFPNYRWNISA